MQEDGSTPLRPTTRSQKWESWKPNHTSLALTRGAGSDCSKWVFDSDVARIARLAFFAKFTFFRSPILDFLRARIGRPFPQALAGCNRASNKKKIARIANFGLWSPKIAKIDFGKTLIANGGSEQSEQPEPSWFPFVWRFMVPSCFWSALCSCSLRSACCQWNTRSFLCKGGFGYITWSLHMIRTDRKKGHWCGMHDQLVADNYMNVLAWDFPVLPLLWVVVVSDGSSWAVLEQASCVDWKVSVHAQQAFKEPRILQDSHSQLWACPGDPDSLSQSSGLSKRCFWQTVILPGRHPPFSSFSSIFCPGLRSKIPSFFVGRMHYRNFADFVKTTCFWSEPFAIGPVQFSWPRRVAENWFTKPGFFGSILSVFPMKSSKTQSSLNFLQSGPRKFTKSDFSGLAPIRRVLIWQGTKRPFYKTTVSTTLKSCKTSWILRKFWTLPEPRVRQLWARRKLCTPLGWQPLSRFPWRNP